MKVIIKKNLYFLIPYLLFLISGIVVLLLFTKPQIHIYMNKFHNFFFDKFFYYITYLGDGIFSIIVISLMLFIRFRHLFFMTCASLFSLSIVTIFKHYFFDSTLRPHTYFQWIYPYKLRLVEGVDYNGFNSFPSGHTMSAFCLFFGLALIVKNKWLKLGCFIIAFLTGYSRVYLSQHFFEDILVGSVIAVVVTLMSFYLFSRIKKNWIDLSLPDVIRKKKQ